MKTPSNTNQAAAFWWKLIGALGLLLAGSAHGATLQLKADLPTSAPLFFPVPAQITLVNEGNEPVTIEDFPRPHLLQIHLTHVSTGTLEYEGYANPLGPPEEGLLRPFPLEPGKVSGFETVFGAKWGKEKEPLAAAFTSTGLFSMHFTYPVMYRENGRPQVEYVRSRPVLLLITNVPAAHQAALEDVRKMPRVAWLMHPKAADMANPTELADFEASLRQHLSKHPDSPWAALGKFALASRLYAKFVRADYQSATLGQEITNLLTDIQRDDRFNRSEAAQLRKRMEQVSQEVRSRAKSKAVPPAAMKAVESRFNKLLGHMVLGETNALPPLLVENFRYNAQLGAAEWLAKLKRDHQATAPFPMTANFKTISVTGLLDETVLIAEVTYESGGHKSVRRVAATYQFARGTWLLAEWKNIGVAKP